MSNYMKVKDLIKELEKYNPEMEIYSSFCPQLLHKFSSSNQVKLEEEKLDWNFKRIGYKFDSILVLK